MDVLFVVMPFADVERPALGISLLAAAAKQRGYSCAVRYFGLDLAERIGLPLYAWIAQRGDQEGLVDARIAESLAGERFFADVAFPGEVPDADAWMERFLGGAASTPALREALREAEPFIDACAAEIARLAPKVVAFTTTFHQTIASLAVARRLAEPRPLVVFGGANCEGDMGVALLEAFPELDAVCTGEGDEVFGPFLDRVLRGQGPPVAGIVERGQLASTPAPVHDLDRLPIPDFSDYFDRVGQMPSISPRLVVETSRGCWWGAKHHCTFCGLNAGGMAYRSKSPERVVDELTGLSDRWAVKRVECVDNILDPRHVGSVFPELSRRNAGLDLFYETKANLRYDELFALRAGGVRAIQPGIESLSTTVLSLMRKGTTAAMNLRLLVWCSELGIDVAWNILFGFPGEPPAEYARMAEIVPLLVHLKPPSYVGPVRLDRWSPLFAAATDATPKPAYAWVFPLPVEHLRRLAYFFDSPSAPDVSYADGLVQAAKAWAERDPVEPPRLDSWATESVAIVRDSRPAAVRSTHVLQGTMMRVCLACDRGGSVRTIAERLGLGDAVVEDALWRLRELRLVVELDGRWVGLAVQRGRGHAVGDTMRSLQRTALPVLR
ncbi:radical SAM/B12 binding domain protein [Minicystis rosea]|nr:radical SAM/B12 binding domain protein [Minicystis rosea]